MVQIWSISKLGFESSVFRPVFLEWGFEKHLSDCEQDCWDAFFADKRRCDVLYGGSDNPMLEKCHNEAEYDRQACNVINCACLCGGC